jgi:hypothetical protein
LEKSLKFASQIASVRHSGSSPSRPEKNPPDPLFLRLVLLFGGAMQMKFMVATCVHLLEHSRETAAQEPEYE